MSSVQIALSQYPLSPLSDFQEWVEKQRQWVATAVSKGSQVLVFPEYGSLELASLLPKGTSLQQQIVEMQSFLPNFLSTFQELSLKNQVAILAPSFPVRDLRFVKPVNRAYFFYPDGTFQYQDKQSLTRFEDEDWGVGPGDSTLRVFTAFGIKFGVSICFDVEFPQKPHSLAKNGVQVLLAPSCTETLQGLNRVHIGARARALENQFFVGVSQTVGEAPWSEAIDYNTGQSALYTPCDKGFADDGVLVRGELQQAGWVYASCEVDLIENVRKEGAVFNFYWMQRQS